MGSFQNGDTAWEFKAATGVIRWGMPYVEVFGSLMNQPPLTFYIQALFLQVFGVSIDTGVMLVTLFGTGSALLLYLIGKELYGKTTGLFAASLFALTPWELVLSRSFLIDVPCLFFSLLCLYTGILATRKGSVKLALVSGLFFAAALLTKLFASFILIPLLLFYFYYHPRNRRKVISQLTVFCVPALVFSYFWYQLILGQGLFYFFGHNDFHELNVYEGGRTYSFVSTFILNYGLGWFLVGAAVFSLLITFYLRKNALETSGFDLICLVTIISIFVVNAFLGVSLNLKVPYTNAIKYDYQSVPFFSLLAASLVSKCLSLFNSKELKIKTCSLFIVIALFLLSATILSDVYYSQQISQSVFLKYTVQTGSLQGYALSNPYPVGPYSLQMIVHYLGYVFVLSGLLLASRVFLKELSTEMSYWIETKNAAAMKAAKEFRAPNT